MSEERNLLQAAASEIRQLRRHIAQLDQKAHAYDMLAEVIERLSPQRNSGGMTEDLAWRIDRHLSATAEGESQDE